VNEFSALIDSILETVALGALALHVIFLFLAIYRAWRGKNSFDRLIGLDLTGTLTLCVLVLVAIAHSAIPEIHFNLEDAIYIDVALGLAALSYITTIALAKYIVNHRVF
jgi:multisubunit Na+/H+ antiporter MnhF subunit